MIEFIYDWMTVKGIVLFIAIFIAIFIVIDQFLNFRNALIVDKCFKVIERNQKMINQNLLNFEKDMNTK